MRKTTLFLLLLCCMQLSWAQNDSTGWPSGKHTEGWEQVQDPVMKQEVAQFNRKGVKQSSSPAATGARLLPIPLKRCTDKFAYFEKGSIYSLDVLVHIFLTGTAPQNRIEKIDLLFYKTPLTLPESALKGIYSPRSCTQFTGKNKPVSADCKAFQSADKQRVYIYMVNGEGKDRYEVTWVVQGRKYLRRIVDGL